MGRKDEGSMPKLWENKQFIIFGRETRTNSCAFSDLLEYLIVIRDD